MAKFFLFVFTILLSLSLGLFVGQNYLLDEEDRNEVAIDSKTDSFLIPSNIELPSLNLRAQFKKLMDKFSANETAEISSPDEDRVMKAKPSEIAPSKTEDQKALVIAKDPVKKVATPDSDLKQIDEEGAVSGWLIQLAAFQDLQDALKTEQQINEAGYPSYTYKAKVNGQSWYRNNIGPFSTAAEATQFKQSQKVHLKFKGAFVRKL